MESERVYMYFIYKTVYILFIYFCLLFRVLTSWNNDLAFPS